VQENVKKRMTEAVRSKLVEAEVVPVALGGERMLKMQNWVLAVMMTVMNL
jgi:hypothetical protein